MPEEESLILNVKSDTVEKGAAALEELTTAATKADAANDNLAAATNSSSKAAGKSATSQDKAARATKKNATSSKLLAAGQAAATKTTRALSLAARGLASTFASLLLPLTAVLTPFLAIKKLLGSTVEIQNYRAQLKTATGSIENAGVAFEALEDFASTTPFALEQSLEAFIKLTNLGLTPSERALKSFGNTASATNKSLVEVVDAVAAASVGEFEQLKKLGIVVRTEGERIKFTFRGVTTEVGKNAAEIEEFLTKIGENEFGGAMADQMATVGGQLSNLSDLWNQLFRTISELGVGNIIGSTVQIGIGALSRLVAMLESGEFELAIKSWTAAYEGWVDDFTDAIGVVSDLFSNSSVDWQDDTEKFKDEFVRQLKILPARIRFYIQRMGVEISSLVVFAVDTAKNIFEIFNALFSNITATAKSFARILKEAFDFDDDVSFQDAFSTGVTRQEKIIDDFSSRFKTATGNIAESLDSVKEARKGAIDEINNEFIQTTNNIDELTKKAKELGENFGIGDDTSIEDRTAGFKLGAVGGSSTGGASGGSSGGSSTGGASGGSKEGKDFTKLVEDLRTEEQLIEESYIRRLELIRSNTDAGSQLRADLEARQREFYDQDVQAFGEKTLRELDITRNGFDLQFEALEEHYERRREFILENETLIEEEKTQLLLDLEQERGALLRGLQLESAKQGLQLASDYLGNFTQLANSNNKTLERIGKGALLVQQGLAIANATIKTYEAANGALASQSFIPISGPALAAASAAAAIAAGLANVAAISSTNTNINSGGSFATGGIVPGASFAGDNVTANVNSAEMILNRSQQLQLFKMANGQATPGGGQGNTIIINQTSVPIEGETRVRPNGDKEIIIRDAVERTKAELANEANTGGGEVVPSIARAFSLKRTGTA